MITANLVTIVGTAIVTIGGLIPVFKLHAKSIGKAVVNNAQPIATVVNHSVQVVEDVAKLPALAEAKVKLAEKEAAFKNSELGRIAGSAFMRMRKDSALCLKMRKQPWLHLCEWNYRKLI